MNLIEGDTLEIRLDDRNGRGVLVIGQWLIRLEKPTNLNPTHPDRWQVTRVEPDLRRENY